MFVSAWVHDPGGGGVLQISGDRDDRSFFFGFFQIEKFWQVFFAVKLDLSRDFFGYSKQSEDS